MATRSRQIGWSSESNMLYNILREIKALQGLAANMSTTTTTSSTTTSNPIVPFYVCPGTGCGSCSISNEITIYILQSCANNLSLGCSVWADDQGTVPYPDGVFHTTAAAYTVVSGVIDTFEPC